MDTETSWLDFLRIQGAQLTPDGDVDGFGPTQQTLLPALDKVALVPLVHLGAIRVSGDDAQSFLQAQLTSELLDVTPAKAGFSGYCTPKGRLLATPLVMMHDADYLLILPRELVAPLTARLAKYVLRAKVHVVDARDDFQLLGLVGAGAALALTQTGERAPQRPLETIRLAHALAAVALPENRLLLVCSATQARVLWTKLASVAGAAAPVAWDILGIRAGIASVLPETQELFLPQMLGLDRYGGVSFSKGCYPGQEIVARTEYLGDLKRRLCRGRSQSVTKVGDSIYAADGGADAVGVVANAVASPEGGFELLAVVQRDAVQRPLRLESPSGPSLTLDGVAAVAAASPEGTR